MELEQALQVLEIIVKKKTPYQNGEETEVAYKAFNIIKEYCVPTEKKVDKSEESK